MQAFEPAIGKELYDCIPVSNPDSLNESRLDLLINTIKKYDRTSQ